MTAEKETWIVVGRNGEVVLRFETEEHAQRYLSYANKYGELSPYHVEKRP